MICPTCRHESEMAYSVLAHGFVCLEKDCGFELEIDDIREADAIAGSTFDLICA